MSAGASDMAQRPTTAREVHLLRRPGARMAADDLGIATVAVPPLQPGQFLVRNRLIALDPVRRVFFADGTAPLNAALFGFAIGTVTESRHPDFPEGAIVAHHGGFRDWAISTGANARLIPPTDDPLEWHADALGVGGFFAYVGLFEIGQLRPGETVFVSSAAGSVGSLVTQMARITGCRVIASAGSEAKCAWLREVAGADAAINYRDGDIAGQLSAAAPDGIDLFFDNVGGQQLDAALGVMAKGGRVVIAGMVSAYDALEPLSERHGGWTKQMLTSQVSLRSFDAFEHTSCWPKFQRAVGGWLRSGAISAQIHVLDGIEAVPDAFVDLLAGVRQGKTLVRVG